MNIKQTPSVQKITVSGHTDRIGNTSANQRLSEQRAEAVQRALANEGVPFSLIQSQGFGSQQPIVQCDQQNRNELITCLAPNRRVDIDVQGQH